MAIVRYLFFEEGAHSGFFGHGKPIAGLQACVYVCFRGPRRCGSAGDLILLQNEDSLLAGLELGCTYPSHVAGQRKAEDDLISFEFWPLEDGLDLQHGFVPARAVFGGAITRGSGLGDLPWMHVRDAPYDHIIRSGYQALQILSLTSDGTCSTVFAPVPPGLGVPSLGAAWPSSLTATPEPKIQPSV